MFKIRKFIKPIAAFLFLNTVCYIFGPTVALALTSGPTAPEYTSFEPVDTTDMVEMPTGDFNYNLPLLEVPGPAGGYPLSLSYHAGILPEEEASWVGLGWTLNPGAITRNVNGYPDDFKDIEGFTRLFWEGGEIKTKSVGLSVGLANVATVTASMDLSQDTYKGRGIGWSAGLSAGAGALNAGVTFGRNGYGQGFGSGRIGLGTTISNKSGTGFANGGVGLSISSGGAQVGFNAGINSKDDKGQKSLFGASISSSGSGGYSANGIGYSSFISNNGSDGSRSFTYSRNIDIPIPFAPIVSLSIGKKYTRYWTDDVDAAEVNGSLYMPSAAYNDEYFDDHDFDVLRLLDGENVTETDANYATGGALPSYDNYMMLGQGIGGAIEPFAQYNYIVNRNQPDGLDRYYNLQPGFDARKPQFRVKDAFSNKFILNEPAFQVNWQSSGLSSIDMSNATIESGDDMFAGYNGHHLYGRNQIEYLTNEEITANNPKIGLTGFINYESGDFNRSLAPDKQIGGFVATNASGVKYHYALPAYNFEEYRYSENIVKPQGTAFNESYNKGQYAYLWHLTAVTGPDYVDNGTPGFDESDYGYWVSFEYGKWTDQYIWRTPGNDMNRDLDTNFQNFSQGKKEIYYLDAIKTKTHTALFVKEIRKDGKSSIEYLKDIGTREVDGERKEIELLTDEARDGGFIPRSLDCECKKIISPLDDVHESNINYTARPVSQLKLKDIYLFDNEALAQVNLDKASGSGYEQDYTYQWIEVGNSPSCPDNAVRFNAHLEDNVLDVNDLPAALENGFIRKISLTTDESLAPLSPNSFDFDLVARDNPYLNPNSYALGGKLTLKQIEYFGKGSSASILPPVKFEYDLPEDYRNATMHLNQLQGVLLSAGDIIKVRPTGSSELSYFVVMENGTSVRKIQGDLETTQPVSIEYTLTKNPPYVQGYKDLWGMFKSDFNEYDFQQNQNMGSAVTDISAKSTDVWSLRTIKNQMGSEIKIDYESDDYIAQVDDRSGQLNLTNVSRLTTSGRLRLFAPPEQINSLGLEVNDIVDIALYFSRRFVNPEGDDSFQAEFMAPDAWGAGSVDDRDITGSKVVGISSNYIDILNQNAWLNATNWFNGSGLKSNVDFIAGNLISYGNQNTLKGGGLRVKSLFILDPVTDDASVTQYQYADNGETSGVSPYTPYSLDNVQFNYPSNAHYHDENRKTQKSNDFRKLLNAPIFDLFAKSAIYPAPGAIYGQVTVQNQFVTAGIAKNMPGYVVYEFETFHPEKYQIAYNTTALTGTGTYRGLTVEDGEDKQVTLTSYGVQEGTLLKTSRYDHSDRLIGTTSTITLDDVMQDNVGSGSLAGTYAAQYPTALGNEVNGQGVIETTTLDARIIRKAPSVTLHNVTTKYTKYPGLVLGTITEDLRSGVTMFERTLAYDFFSGDATEHYSEDGYGEKFVTKTVPAFRLQTTNSAAYPEMGIGSMFNENRNMLTQEGASFTFKITDDFDVNVEDWNNHKESLLGASLQTWKDLGNKVMSPTGVLTQSDDGLYRKRSSYSFIGDGTINPDGTQSNTNIDVDFKVSNVVNSSSWRKSGEGTLFDVNSHVLEAKDINGNYATTKFDIDLQRVYSAATNVRYNAYAYSGAEDAPLGNAFGGGVLIGEGTVSSSSPHRGQYALDVNANQKGFSFEATDVKQGATYLISCWTTKPDQTKIVYTINGNTAGLVLPAETLGQVGNWYQIRAKVKLASNVTKANFEVKAGTQSIKLDDFLVKPADAGFTGYAYNQWGELSDVINANNLSTHYEYDEMGRLKSVWTESFQYGKKKVSENTIKYINQN